MDKKLEQEVSDILAEVARAKTTIDEITHEIRALNHELEAKKALIQACEIDLRNKMCDAQEVSIKIEDFANVSLVKGRESVIITDATIVPEKYKSYEPVIKVNKNDLKKVLSKGIAVEGAELQRGEGTVKINFK